MKRLAAIFAVVLLPEGKSQPLVVQNVAKTWLIVGNETAAYVFNQTTNARPSFNTLTLPSLLNDAGWQLEQQLLHAASAKTATIPTILNAPLPVVANVDGNRLVYASGSQEVTIVRLGTAERQAITLDPDNVYLSMQARIQHLTLAGDGLFAITFQPGHQFVLTLYNLTTQTAIFAYYDTPTTMVAVRMVATRDYVALQAINTTRNVSVATFRRIPAPVLRLINAFQPLLALDADTDILLLADRDMDSNPRVTLYLHHTVVWQQHFDVVHAAVSSPYVLVASPTTVWLGQVDLLSPTYAPLLSFALHSDAILNACPPDPTSNVTSCLQLNLMQSDLIITTAAGMARLPWDTIQALHVADETIRVTTRAGGLLLLSATRPSASTPTTLVTSTMDNGGSAAKPRAVSGTVTGVVVGLALFGVLTLALTVVRKRDGWRTVALLSDDDEVWFRGGGDWMERCHERVGSVLSGLVVQP